MRLPFCRILLLGCCVFLAASPLAAADKKAAKPAPPSVITQLSWLTGHWRMEKAGRVVDEQWMAPAGGVMLGMSRTVAKSKAIEHEFMQIREGPGGALFFVAQPSGQEEGTFQILNLSQNEAIFENRLHDFPQRIAYTHQPDGSLLAVISGLGTDGQEKRVEFTYQRVSP